LRRLHGPARPSGLALGLAVVFLSACSLTGSVPPTERAQRLGRSSWSLPRLGPSKTQPASGFFLTKGVVERIGKQEYRLRAWLDGPSPTDSGPLDVRWLITTPGEVPSELILQETEQEGALLEAHVRGDGNWNVRLEVSGRRLPAMWLEFSHPGARTAPPWPDLLSGQTVPLDPWACDSPRFPRQVGDFHLGCSPQSSDGPRLDRKIDIETGRAFPMAPLVGLARDEPPKLLRPGWASPSSGLAPKLIWQTPGALGIWPAPQRQAKTPSLSLPKGEFRGRPVSDGLHFAFARPDRIEIGDVSTWTRTLLHTRPTDATDVLALGGQWLARLDDMSGSTELILRDRTRRREVVVPTAAEPARPILAGQWLLWEDQEGFHGLPLQGGRAWSIPLRTDRSIPPTLLDDWLLLSKQGGDDRGLVALHIPSGQLRRPVLSGDRRRTEARGAGAGRLSLWERTTEPGTFLTVFALSERQFSPRGPLADGDPLVGPPPGAQRGGAAETSASAWLPKGGERTLSFDPGTRSQLVETWVGQHDRPSPVDLERGGRLIGRTQNFATPPPGVPGHWVLLGVLPSQPDTDAEQRAVRLRWFAGDSSRTVGKLRLRPLEEQL
jgi:hypothetical protein